MLHIIVKIDFIFLYCLRRGSDGGTERNNKKCSSEKRKAKKRMRFHKLMTARATDLNFKFHYELLNDEWSLHPNDFKRQVKGNGLNEHSEKEQNLEREIYLIKLICVSAFALLSKLFAVCFRFLCDSFFVAARH